MILYYDFNNVAYYKEYPDVIMVNEKRFPLEIPDDDDDLIKLKEKYYELALDKAAYKTTK